MLLGGSGPVAASLSLPYPARETIELDAQGREAIVLDIALPVLAAWAQSVRVFGFRASMGVSGLSPREVARIRTLGLATGARGTGIFEGATDFRLGFHHAPPASLDPSLGIDADLEGSPIAPVVSDLMIAAFGLNPGERVAHEVRGLTHVRAASAHGYGARTFRLLGRELGLDLDVNTAELGFEPQGVGRVSVTASRSADAGSGRAGWKDRGAFRAVHALIGAVRPKGDQLDKVEACLKEVLWEARRVEPSVVRLVTAGVDLGAFLQVDVEWERGGATFMDVAGRSAAPLALARRIARKALGAWDDEATCDGVTGPLVLAACVAARAGGEFSLLPSNHVRATRDLLRDLGATVDESEAPGLVVLKTTA